MRGRVRRRYGRIRRLQAAGFAEVYRQGNRSGRKQQARRGIKTGRLKRCRNARCFRRPLNCSGNQANRRDKITMPPTAKIAREIKKTANALSRP
nr:MAG TPA: hypothetical protein [Caudoviricetes sp.]